MTYKETILAIRGYEKRQMRDWERARLIAYQIYAGIPKKGNNKPIHQYLPLPSDSIQRKSKEEMDAVRKFFINKQKEANEKLRPN